jgi:hypothetical protein
LIYGGCGGGGVGKITAVGYFWCERKVKNIIFKCGKIIKKYIYIE